MPARKVVSKFKSYHTGGKIEKKIQCVTICDNLFHKKTQHS